VSQGSEERRKLLQLVVSNSTWKHGRLALELHAPFDLILKEASKAREADARDLANGIKRPAFENWRTGWDLNPGQPCGCTAFPVLRLRPDSATCPAKEV
jgi:hypothetical protein